MKRKFWNWIKNQDESGSVMRTLFLNEEISDETWYGDEVTPKLFKDELESGTGPIYVWINSLGGDVFAAAQIYNMLMDYPYDVTVKIDGLAASAASVTGMASDVVKCYRVRKSWADAASQLGAYTVLDNAKAMADKHSGYTVYDWNGKAVYGAEVSGGSGSTGEFSNADCPFLVKVSIDDLNIRKGAGTNTAKTGMYTGVGLFTILEVKIGKGSDAGWGRLKSGAGWISLDYCQRV